MHLCAATAIHFSPPLTRRAQALGKTVLRNLAAWIEPSDLPRAPKRRTVVLPEPLSGKARPKRC